MGDRKPRVMVLDTYYPEFVRCLPNPKDYKTGLQEVLEMSFGTADFYSRNLNLHGLDVIDVIANHLRLQTIWMAEKNKEYNTPQRTVLHQIEYYKPDVLFCQDLSFFPADYLKAIKNQGVRLFAQCSCPMPAEENVRQFEVIFTSFPHYVDKFKQLGVRGVYNKLAFDPIVLERLMKRGMTDFVPEYDISFIGGVGWPSHWFYGMKVLESVAYTFKNSNFWGYGYDKLPDGMVVKNQHRGEAWGLDMYRILTKSKIVINRHGEVAQGYTNNMRTFEATGCGALLMTEASKNLESFFDPGTEVFSYTSIDDLLKKIDYLLKNEGLRAKIAAAGQSRTHDDHTYFQTMGTVARTIRETLGW